MTSPSESRPSERGSGASGARGDEAQQTTPRGTGPERTGLDGPTPGGTLELLAAVRGWHGQDPDAVTRAELETLIDGVETGSDDALAALHDRFDTRLQFGTAGLRGAIGAGPNRMNRVLVAQAAAGLAAWLLSEEGRALRDTGRTGTEEGHALRDTGRTGGTGGTGGTGAEATERRPAPTVVVGYDGRTNSRVFALDTAELMAGAGVRAILLPRLLPTPVLAFAVRYFDADAGVMVTASHNPAADNGYKVYAGGIHSGSQIVAPLDAAIAKHIVEVATGSVADLPRSDGYEIAGEAVLDEYIRRTADLAGPVSPRLRVVYTAMHGVGWETAERVIRSAGFAAPIPVTEQQEPDAAFPSVAFPNPEEPGALDLALRTAEEHDADVVIANDPDADRLAVAVPTPDGWQRLSGNDVGALLGWRAAERVAAARAAASGGAGAAAAGSGAGDAAEAAGGDLAALEDGALAASLVSSPALREVADAYGLTFIETLTGFKWISRVPNLVFGFEEALGYLVDPEKVRDKDGISAAVDVLALAEELATEGLGLQDRLDAFAERFGAFASGQVSIRVTDLGDIPRVMAHLRASPPTELADSPVTQADDFRRGVDGFPPSDILRYRTADGARIIVRPSGTEPKLKMYIDASSSTGTGSERRERAGRAVAALEQACRDLVRDALR